MLLSCASGQRGADFGCLLIKASASSLAKKIVTSDNSVLLRFMAFMEIMAFMVYLLLLNQLNFQLK